MDKGYYKIIAIPPGKLGLNVQVVNDDGAIIRCINPSCVFKSKISIGDVIMTVDGRKVNCVSDLKIGKDKQRKFGIVASSAVGVGISPAAKGVASLDQIMASNGSGQWRARAVPSSPATASFNSQMSTLITPNRARRYRTPAPTIVAEDEDDYEQYEPPPKPRNLCRRVGRSSHSRYTTTGMESVYTGAPTVGPTITSRSFKSVTFDLGDGTESLYSGDRIVALSTMFDFDMGGMDVDSSSSDDESERLNDEKLIPKRCQDGILDKNPDVVKVEMGQLEPLNVPITEVKMKKNLFETKANVTSKVDDANSRVSKDLFELEYAELQSREQRVQYKNIIEAARRQEAKMLWQDEKAGWEKAKTKVAHSGQGTTLQKQTSDSSEEEHGIEIPDDLSFAPSSRGTERDAPSIRVAIDEDIEVVSSDYEGSYFTRAKKAMKLLPQRSAKPKKSEAKAHSTLTVKPEEKANKAKKDETERELAILVPATLTPTTVSTREGAVTPISTPGEGTATPTSTTSTLGRLKNVAALTLTSMHPPRLPQLNGKAFSGKAIPDRDSSKASRTLTRALLAPSGAKTRQDNGKPITASSNKIDTSNADSAKRSQWRAVVDMNNYKTYYYNKKTKEVTWTKPVEFYNNEDKKMIEEAGAAAKNKNSLVRQDLSPFDLEMRCSDVSMMTGLLSARAVMLEKKRKLKKKKGQDERDDLADDDSVRVEEENVAALPPETKNEEGTHAPAEGVKGTVAVHVEEEPDHGSANSNNDKTKNVKTTLPAMEEMEVPLAEWKRVVANQDESGEEGNVDSAGQMPKSNPGALDGMSYAAFTSKLSLIKSEFKSKRKKNSQVLAGKKHNKRYSWLIKSPSKEKKE